LRKSENGKILVFACAYLWMSFLMQCQ